MDCGPNRFFYYERPVYKEPSNPQNNNKAETDPLQTLNLRLARGEITIEEYINMKQVVLGIETHAAEIVEEKKEVVSTNKSNQPVKSTKPQVSLKKA